MLRLREEQPAFEERAGDRGQRGDEHPWPRLRRGDRQRDAEDRNRGEQQHREHAHLPRMPACDDEAHFLGQVIRLGIRALEHRGLAIRQADGVAAGLRQRLRPIKNFLENSYSSPIY